MRRCEIQGCDGEHAARGMCKLHYARWQRGGSLDGAPAEYTSERTACQAPGCYEVFTQRARGSKRLYCSRLCRSRVQAQRRRSRPDYVPPHQRPDRRTCKVFGCDRPYLSRGYCVMHYSRIRNGSSVGGSAPRRSAPGSGTWRKMDNGYMRRSINGRTELQHRVVMEEHLGRALRKYENVHHINGVRDDNRVENLEIWVKPQPCGQRPQDLVDWVISEYPDLVQAAIGTK